MKKSLVFAMAMALGVTASAYAANPFSDVPAGHWAYDAVENLAANGVVDGYGTTFGGDKLMTRYEMAQIVAKAMAKGAANCEKLAAEFADELQAMGVRVAKLEKKVDNVKITGQVRFDYKSHNGDINEHVGSSTGGATGFSVMRTRIFVNGQINDNWSYTGMIQNERGLTSGDGDNNTIGLKRAYLEGRVGGVKVLAGHWNEFFINDTILDDFVDGAYLEYGLGNGKVYGMVGKDLRVENKWHTSPIGTNFDSELWDSDRARVYVVGVSQKVGAVNLALNYFKLDAGDTNWGRTTGNSLSRGIWNLNADWAIAKDWALTGRYMMATKDAYGEWLGTDTGKNGWYGQLNFKGADSSKAGTWGARVRYFNQPHNVFLSPTYDCTNFGHEGGGYKGWGVGVDWTLAKNVLLQSDFYDTRAMERDVKDQTWYTQLYFFF